MTNGFTIRQGSLFESEGMKQFLTSKHGETGEIGNEERTMQSTNGTKRDWASTTSLTNVKFPRMPKYYKSKSVERVRIRTQST